jgi:hypothetical protein
LSGWALPGLWFEKGKRGNPINTSKKNVLKKTAEKTVVDIKKT